MQLDWQNLFLSLLVFKLTLELYLNLRNKNHIIKHRHEVPEKFKDAVSIEDHKRAVNYGLAKLQFSRFNLIFTTIILYLWTIGGGLEMLDQWASSFALSTILTGIVFFLLFGLVSTIISLPIDWYNTFVLEEKFGFNKTTKKIFFSDLLKQTVLGLVIGLPILYGLMAIMESLGSLWWLYAWGFLTTFQFFILWLYPSFIAPLFNKFTPLEDGETKKRIEQLAERINFSLKGIMVMDASKRSGHGNAYFTGLGKQKRIVFFDTLLNSLLPQEIEAVLAHELGHFKRKHIVKGLIRGLIMSLVGFWILGQVMQSEVFYNMHGVQSESTYIALMLFMLVTSVYTFWITPIYSWWSRKYEFEADAYAAEHSSSKDLISALIKMYKDNASPLTTDKLYSRFYHSHPPAFERVQHLEKFSS